MNTISIRRALRALLPSPDGAAAPLVVQPIGFDDGCLPWVSSLLRQAGEDLGRPLLLDRGRGDLVLAEQAFVQQVTPLAGRLDVAVLPATVRRVVGA